VALQQPQKQERHDLHGHDANEVPPEPASRLVLFLFDHRAAVFFLLGAGVSTSATIFAYIAS